ncbi:Phage P2 GpU [compost metagenome]
MVEGTGRLCGLWVIDNLTETRTIFFPNGAARRIEFSLSLKRVDDGRMDLLEAATGAGLNIVRGLL